ncbi:hypothetical protein C8F04DRAFT_1153629 [Mycena alexandri]|uniref:Uncharacterized protein n=1 Tax=Mycena alexandri TaxID=1745969 RepID=A0AAD6WMH3_9AGAR|nr:hypothetical protein C8F04DRAFT_1153629 [Mycena alexandri]
MVLNLVSARVPSPAIRATTLLRLFVVITPFSFPSIRTQTSRAIFHLTILFYFFYFLRAFSFFFLLLFCLFLWCAFSFLPLSFSSCAIRRLRLH